MKMLKYITYSGIALSLSACVATDDTEQNSAINNQALNTPATWSTDVNSNAAGINISGANISGPRQWLESFNDPLLLKLVAEGKANNFELKAAAANMNKAWLLAEKSGAALKPTLDLSLGKTQLGNMSGGSSNSSVNVGLKASWEFDVWGRIQSGVDAAQASAEATQADHVFAEHSLSANIAKNYFKVIEAMLQADINQLNLNILEKNLRIAQAKYKNGSSSSQDIALNKANLATGKEQLIATNSSKRDAIRALEVLLGRYPNASLDIPAELPALPSSPPAGIPSSILERRPDLISAERQIASAFSHTKQAKAAQLPSFSLTSSINGSSNSLSDILSPSNVAWQLAANLLAPIYDGGSRRIAVEIATIEQKQALDNYRQKALVAFSEVERNLDLGVTLAKREVALAEAYLQHNKAYRIAELRYKEGESELLDTLQIQQQTISAKSNLLSIKRSQLEQRINLYLALGGSW